VWYRRAWPGLIILVHMCNCWYLTNFVSLFHGNCVCLFSIEMIQLLKKHASLSICLHWALVQCSETTKRSAIKWHVISSDYFFLKFFPVLQYDKGFWQNIVQTSWQFDWTLYWHYREVGKVNWIMIMILLVTSKLLVAFTLYFDKTFLSSL